MPIDFPEPESRFHTAKHSASSPINQKASPAETSSLSSSAPASALNLALDRLEDSFGLNPPPEAIVEAFTAWVESTGKSMYQHQEDSLLQIVTGDHLIVATPTGSGKSLIALSAIFHALAHGKTAYYTAPLKALVSEKFFELIAVFGAHNVGMVTGDSAINANAPIICATAEILANMALRTGADTDCDIAVLDEFHYYSDPQRGWAWQVPLIELPHTQFVLLSATLGDTTELCAKLEDRTSRPVSIIDDAVRPVPLKFSYSDFPTPDVIQDLVATHMAPVYVVHFSQAEAVKQAQGLLGINLISKEQKEAIANAIADFKFGTGFGKDLSKLLRNGIAVHHAGLLPRYRRLVERLAQSGLLNVICGTDTLGVGINVPIRTVLITSLAKFDGTKMRHLTAREFHQIAGRAGRAGFDTIGYVVVQAPEHEIENARRVRKAGGDPQKLSRVQKVKPEPGTLQWSEKTFNSLIERQPETLKSQLQINHSLILNLLQRKYPVSAFQDFLSNNHEPKTERNLLIRQAAEVYKSLRQTEIITHHDRDWRAAHPDSSPIEFKYDVPDSFALNSPLAPFALAAFELLDPESANYALDLVSIIESVAEDPTPALVAQKKVARSELANKLREQGMDYTERMQKLDEVTWPQPLQDLLSPAFKIYLGTNPWAREYELSPKSIVREMIENAMTFSDFISRYDLVRSEGIVLRYLTDVYRTLKNTVPISALTDEVQEITSWLGKLVRAVDSSLLDEWEALAVGTNPNQDSDSHNNISANIEGQELAFGADENGKLAFTKNKHNLRTEIRNAMFQLVEAIDREDIAYLARLDSATNWDENKWNDALDAYFEEYEYVGTDMAARSEKFFQILEDPSLADLITAGVPEEYAAELLEKHFPGRLWLTIQVIDDGEEDLAWALWALIDLDRSDKEDQLALELIRFAAR